MNRTFFKSLVLFLAIVLSGNMAYAQRNASNQLNWKKDNLERSRNITRMYQRVQMLTKRLALSTKQVDEVKVIEEQYFNDEQWIRDRDTFDNNMDGSLKNNRRQDDVDNPEHRLLYLDYIKLRQEADNKIAELLTEIQKSKFAKIRESDIKYLEDRMNGIRNGNQQFKNQNTKSKVKVSSFKNNKSSFK